MFFSSSKSEKLDKDSSTTYYLTYYYEIDGNTYYVSSNNSTSVIPKVGSEKIIYYNPENPSESQISGSTNYLLILTLGVMFTCLPLLILFDKPRIENEGIYYKIRHEKLRE